MSDGRNVTGATLQKVTGVAGIVGMAIIALGMIIAAAGYTGRFGEAYRVANHFVSELGERAVSERAWAFNVGLIVGGVFLVAFVVGLVARLKGWMRWVIGAVGVVSGVFAALVGVFPMDNISAHMLVANGFFYPGLVVMLLFSVYVLLSRHHELPRPLCIPGFGAAGSLFVFLFLGAAIEARVNGPSFTPDFGANRPDVWVSALSEWVAIGAVLVWVFAVAVILVARDFRH